MRKIFLFLFCVCISLSLFAEDIEINNIYYRLNASKKTAEVIQNPNKYSGDIVIPDSIEKDGVYYIVTSIKGQRGGSVNILELIGEYEYNGAFYGCSALKTITIPQSINTIGRYAFLGCSSLEGIYISDLSSWCNISFESEGSAVPEQLNPLLIAHNLYLNGNLITDLVIPDDILELKVEAFAGINVKSVKFHKKFNTLGQYSFYRCRNIEDIYVYSSRLNGTTAFCDKNEEGDYSSTCNDINLHIRERYKDYYENNDYWKSFKKIEYISGIDYNLTYNIDNTKYKSFVMEVGETIVPEPAPTKEGYTFSGWSEIPETMPGHDLTITGSFSPNTYKLIYMVDGITYKEIDVKYDEDIILESYPVKKGMTFSGWSSIPEKMPAKDVTVTGSFSWSKITNNKIIYQVTDTINNCAAVIGNEEASGRVTIASDLEFDYNYKVTSIADRAFFGCKDITSIVIPATITNIGERAFAKIDKLTDVTITAEDVPTTDRTAFENSYIDYVTLHVPAGSVEKYKAAGPWKNFKEIVPIEGGQTKIVSIHSVDKQKASYNLNGIKISETNKISKGIFIRGGKKYYIR